MTKKQTKTASNKTIDANTENKDVIKNKKVSGKTHGKLKDKEADTDGGTTDDEIKSEASKLEELAASVGEWKDKYLRLTAEFDNYRKRTLKEKADLLKLANEDLLKAILPVVEDSYAGI